MHNQLTPKRAVLAWLLMLPLAAFAQLRSPTYGWNLGNTMEAPSGVGTWDPAPTQALINAVASAGFNTVRIPCAWDSNANQSTRQIRTTYMAQVKQVVDWCYAKNLTVIINCHWDNGWLENNITGTVDPTINAKMNSYWTQIANTFKTYDSRLLFAGANEPSVDTAAQMSTLTTYYQTFINAVRATGGNNSSRWLIIQGPSTNIDKTNQLMNTLPSDSTAGRLIVEVHYYDPYQLTLMTADASWGKMFYFWGQGYHSATRTDRNATWGEEAAIDSEFKLMQDKFVSRGIPVLVGEFGSVRRTGYSDLTGSDLNLHLASRTYFDKTIVDKANAIGLRPVYWDDGGNNSNSFGLFNRTTAALFDSDAARALTGGAALPPPGSSTITLQAESGTVAGGTTIDSNNAGYIGTGFANFPTTGGSLQFTNVNGGSAAGTHTVTVRYALGATTARTGRVLVNGTAQNVTCQPTGSWTTWKTLTFNAALNSGTSNTLRFESTGQDFGNVDQISYIVQ